MASMSRIDDYGPLSLQMGSVSTGVADLVHGYEQLVTRLPDLTETVLNVHANTEQMTKELEHRTRSLVDGYEYLQGLSTLLPETFLETAATHRKTLQNAINLMTPEEHAKIAESAKTLETIRGDLQSITLERTIMETMMRPKILESRRVLTRGRADNEKVLHKRYSHTGTESHSARSQQQQQKQQQRAVTSPRRVVASPPAFGSHLSVNAAAPACGNQQSSTRTSSRPENRVDTVGFDHTAELLGVPIHIPQYDPAAAARAQHRSASASASASSSSNTQQLRATEVGGEGRRPDLGLGGYLNHTAGSSARLHARSVAGSIMVPAMSHALPAEVQHLKTVPTPAVTAADFLDREMRRLTRKRTVRRTKVVVVEKEPLAQSLRDKLGHTVEEVNTLKMRLAQGHDAFGKDQSKAIARLQALVKQLQEQRDGRDEALLAAVQKLLAEYMVKKAPPSMDAEILKALEALLVPPKRVAVIDRLHEYKVLTARAKTPVRTVPVITPVPRPLQEEDKGKCVEVQTEPIPTPEPLPVVAPAPAAPQSIIINMPSAPAPVAAPAPAGLEKELIALMHSVVDTQHQTMQGNQALILSLIHERNAQPPPAPETEEEEEVSPTPPRAPSPPPVVAPVPPPAAAPMRPGYSTAFGCVVLGADLMTGPYATPPTIVPPALQPCQLRGIPLPRPRRALVPAESGLVEASSDPDNAPPHLRRDGEELDALPLDNTPIAVEGGVVATGVVTTHETSSTPLAVSSAEKDAGNDNKPAPASDAANEVTPFSAPEAAPAAVAVAAEGEDEHVNYLLPPGDDKANIGLSGAGTASTAGKGGSVQRSTPGSVRHVDLRSIPPHMRRVASDFTMRALWHPYRGDLQGLADAAADKARAEKEASQKQQQQQQQATLPGVAGTPQPAAGSEEAQPLLTLLQNLHTLSTTAGPFPSSGTCAAVVTPESIAEMVSDGVQRGVKEALGLLDTHSPHTRTYYLYPHGEEHSARHKPAGGAKATVTIAAPASRSQVVMLSATDKPDDAVRESLQLLKSRRGCGRDTRAVIDARDAQQYHSRHTGLTSRNMPHHRRQENDVRDSHLDRERDSYGPPRTTRVDVDQLRMDREIRKEVENSRFRARKLLDADENSSFNDSVSLDEETAAHLRDPLTYNLQKEGGDQDVSSSSDLSLEGAGGERNVRLMHRDEHEQRHSELFSENDRPVVRDDLPHRTPAGAGYGVGAGRIVPLVSRLLAQSATEEALQRDGGIGAFHLHASVDSAAFSDDMQASRDADADLWDMNVSSLRADNHHSAASAKADAAAVSSSATLASMASGGLKLLKKAGGALDRRSGGRAARSPASSVSIMTRSAESSSTEDSRGSVQFIPPVSDAAEAVEAAQSKQRLHRILHPPREIGEGLASNPHFSPRSSQSSEESQLPYKRSGRPSLLPRYSYAAPASSSARSSARSSSSLGRHADRRSHSRSRERRRSRTDASVSDLDADPAGTERLATQMMLNVLELHRPGSYTTRPHLSNPIGPRYHSRMCATDSDKSDGGANGSDSSSDAEAGSGLGYCTGSSVSSGGELLDGTPAGAVGNARGGARLMGVNLGTKLLSIRSKKSF